MSQNVSRRSNSGKQEQNSPRQEPQNSNRSNKSGSKVGSRQESRQESNLGSKMGSNQGSRQFSRQGYGENAEYDQSMERNEEFAAEEFAIEEVVFQNKLVKREFQAQNEDELIKELQQRLIEAKEALKETQIKLQEEKSLSQQTAQQVKEVNKKLRYDFKPEQVEMKAIEEKLKKVSTKELDAFKQLNIRKNQLYELEELENERLIQEERFKQTKYELESEKFQVSHMFAYQSIGKVLLRAIINSFRQKVSQDSSMINVSKLSLAQARESLERLEEARITLNRLHSKHFAHQKVTTESQSINKPSSIKNQTQVIKQAPAAQKQVEDDYWY